MSEASRRHASRRCVIGHITESIPSSFTPRRMNGSTVVRSSVPAVRPQFAMAPPYAIERVSQARMSPPTASTAPAHVAFSRGRVPISSVARDKTADAPSSRRNVVSSFPVSAVT